MDETNYLSIAEGRLAYQYYHAPLTAPKKSGIFFLSGYGSDMLGTKASFLAEKCRAAGRDCLRFDYQGHGQSSGNFVDGTIGLWFQDALTLFDQLTNGPQLLAGSSMGGWIGLLLARARPERVAGFIGIAAAPDFTTELVLPSLTTAQGEALQRDGLIYDKTAPPDHNLPMTLKLIEESRQHLLLGAPLQLKCPVHLLQGQKDAEVPWPYALRLSDAIDGPDNWLTFIKNGDHRLSRPEDLALLWQIIASQP